jgi:diaminopimelate epimerase
MSDAPNNNNTAGIPIIKMNGAGNDFIIFDARKAALSLTPQQITEIADRKNIGCDQVIIMRSATQFTQPSPLTQSVDDLVNQDDEFKNALDAFGLNDRDILIMGSQTTEEVDCEMEIYNSDGSLSGACGNATRCVAAILLDEFQPVAEPVEAFLNSELKHASTGSASRNIVKIKTAAGVLKAWRDGALISVNMGKPNFDWQKIPLAQDLKKIALYGFEFVTVNVGNPHAIAFITSPLTDEKFFEIGPAVENDKLFPQKTNVEFARILSDDLIEVRVWERGAGETLACGTGACAVAVLAIKNALVKTKKITTRFKGGDLIIEWNGDEIVMTGNYETEFRGTL